ncbi:four helix bundle protein [Algoriphagus namhaensis]|uniref:Four helix bundle protein n=1 Tax=Algoriphagus namhaensis TaxID=915353 RepID=A0ABV8ASD1_9BACT
MKSYQDLEIYTFAIKLFMETHRFSLKLPKYETYELGSQLRRSSDSVNSNIVEGYGRRRYKNDFVKFLVYAHSSNLECKNHLIKISSLYPELSEEAKRLSAEYDLLGIKIHRFIQYVEKSWLQNGK